MDLPARQLFPATAKEKVNDMRDILVCCNCRGELQWRDSAATCISCGSEFPFENGIINMLPKENESERRLYRNLSYTKLKSMQHAVHHAHYVDSLSGRLERKFKQHLMTMVHDQASTVVDLGCGTGTGFDMFRADQKIIGVDRDMNLLNRCRKNYPETMLICCDMAYSPFRAEIFSSVFAIAILEHLYWLDRVLFQIQKMLSTSGSFYVLIPTEGAISWTLARNLFTLRRNAKIVGITPSEMAEAMRVEHCNTVFAVDSAIRKFFHVDECSLWPLNFGGVHLNLVKCYRLSSI